MMCLKNRKLTVIVLFIVLTNTILPLNIDEEESLPLIKKEDGEYYE